MPIKDEDFEQLFIAYKTRLEQQEKQELLSNEETLTMLYEKGLYPYASRMGFREYDRELMRLQIEMLKLQRHIINTDAKVAVVCEGRDAAGKGGTIKRFMQHLNPRYSRVVALVKPSDAEQHQWYFQRYIRHLPTNGEIIFFDRSWYNRAGVEKVMGFCTPDDLHVFYQQAPRFEEMLVQSHIHLIKFWFSVSRLEQLRRFHDRMRNPLKKWKLSPMDLESIDKWSAYTDAKLAMFTHTDRPMTPWVVVRSDDKRRARLEAIRYLLSLFNYPEKNEVLIGNIDKNIISW